MLWKQTWVLIGEEQFLLKTIGGTSLEGALRSHVAQLCFKKGQIYLRVFLIYYSWYISLICSPFAVRSTLTYWLEGFVSWVFTPISYGSSQYCYSLLNQASVQNCFCSLLPSWRLGEARGGGICRSFLGGMLPDGSALSNKDQLRGIIFLLISSELPSVLHFP